MKIKEIGNWFVKMIFGITKIILGLVFAYTTWYIIESEPPHKEDDVYIRSQEMLGTKINGQEVTGADLNREQDENKPWVVGFFALFAITFLGWGSRDLFFRKF